MRLLHTADWHLGRLFHNLSLLDDQRHVLQQLLEIIDREQVDAVLVAGDIYDRSVPPAAADALPKKARQLIGYRSSPALNFIEGLDEGHVLDLTETFSES